MKRQNSTIYLAIGLVILSAILYGLHFLVFKDPQQEAFWFVMDLAFVPINVLLVTLIIEQLLERRDKRALLEKMNMIIGTFFSEVGTDLLRRLGSFDPQVAETRNEFAVGAHWTDRDYLDAGKRLKGYNLKTDSQGGDIEQLKRMLVQKRDFMVRLLENPNLLEHETFTELLWAVFHLTEELSAREDFTRLPHSDYAHLSVDMKRAYGLLIAQWLLYMQHLKGAYPYLYSLAVRMDPFTEHPSAVVEMPATPTPG
jgi:hypothetical protein